MRPRTMFCSAIAALAVLGVTLPASRAAAATVSFCDFHDLSAFKLNGSAQQANTALRLTQNTGGQAGSAWLTTPFQLPTGTSLHAYFRIQITPPLVFGGADGMTFALQNANVTALGNNGEGLGFQGIKPSYAVEFDTYQDSYDPSNNHIALIANGDQTKFIADAPAPVKLDAGGVVYVWVDVDGSAKSASVYVSGSAARPGSPLISGALDLSTLNGAAFVGFTGGTGTFTDDHDVLELDFSTDGSPCCPSNPGAACSGATPVCSAAGLCVASSSSTSSSGGASSSSSTTTTGSSTAASSGSSGSSGAGGASTSSTSSTTGSTGTSTGTGGSSASTSSTSTSTSTSGGGGSTASGTTVTSTASGSTTTGVGGAGSTSGAGGAGGGANGAATIVDGGGCDCDVPGHERDVRLSAIGALGLLLFARARRRR